MATTTTPPQTQSTLSADEVAALAREKQSPKARVGMVASYVGMAVIVLYCILPFYWMIVSALRMVSELERMGDLSVHVAKIARLRVPSVAVPDELRPTMEQMARTAEDMVRRVRDIIVDRDVEAAIELGRDDEVMDQLRRKSFVELLSDDWAHGVEAAVDIALLGRYYERIADHAVSVANRVVFVVTGEVPVEV